MAIRKILTLEQPVLRAKAKKVSRFDTYLERLVADMWETMRAAPGVGLAAPQIGESIRMLVAEYEDQHVALVNPEIIKIGEETELGTEGCLSIPGYVGDNVPRALKVTVKARDPKGKEIRIKAEGWFARILQHEIDHLDGILFIDRIRPEDVRRVTEDEIVEEGEVVEKEPDGSTHVEKKGRTTTGARGQQPATKGRSGKAAAGRSARSSRAAKAGGGR